MRAKLFMVNKFNILLCDITHDTTALANEVFPLNIGLVGAYLQKTQGNKVSIELSKFIIEIEKLIKTEHYDVVAFSNYPWNLNAGIALSELAKKINPNVIIIFGGPNFPYGDSEQVDFLNKYSLIDAYVFQGGELPFANLTDFLINIDPDTRRHRLINTKLPGIVSLNNDGERIYGGLISEEKDLDFIPSPYLTGLMDKFFLDRRLSPMIQTNRGCPFTCAFCADGHASQSKVKLFSMERVKEELNYIAERIDPELQKTLFITDLNFGMLPRDIEIASLLGDIYEKTNYNFPTYIHATTGKNSKERVIEATKILAGNLQLSMAMQSTDEMVLKNVRRSNIRLEDYTALMPTLKSNKQSTYGEIILGLPGETLESHLKTIYDLMLMRVDAITPHQLMMLNGAELNTEYTRNKYDFVTKYRVLTRDFSIIDSNYIVEVEEVLVQTKDLSYDDYLYARQVHFILGMINNPGLNIIINLIIDLKLNPLELLRFIIDNKGISEIETKCQSIISNFTKDTREELFDDEQDMIKYYSIKENFNKLVEGIEGKNLLQTHITGWISSDIKVMIGMIELWFKEKSLLELSKVKDCINYIKAKSSKIFTKNRLQENVSIEVDHDLTEWLKNPEKGLDNYKLPFKETLNFIITQEQYNELERSLDIFGRNNQGIAKAYIRLGPESFWRKCFKNDLIADKNFTSQPSSKLSSSSMSH